MTTILLILSFLLFSGGNQDFLILRTGEDVPGKIIQASDDVITILVSDKNNPHYNDKENTTIPTSNVYMLHYKDRGNFYINSSGHRVSGEKQKLDDKADIIYLVRGAEIPAYDLQVGETKITYRATKKKTKALSSNVSVNREDVFMIVYTDGSRDVFTDLSRPVVEEAPQPEPVVEETAPAEEEEELKVVFHTVKRGDSLESVAKQYAVTVDDIVLWNELSSSLNPKGQLTIGLQLMVYVKPVK